MSSLVDAFAKLGLSQNSTFVQVKKAFHVIALRNHSDKRGTQTPAEEEQFKLMTAAYSLLKEHFEPSVPDAPHPDDVVPPSPPTPSPHPPPRQAEPEEVPSPEPEEVPSPEPEEVPSPEPVRRPPPRVGACRHGMRCTYYGCNFAHPYGHVAPETPPECRYGRYCRFESTCIFMHKHETVQWKDGEIFTTTTTSFRTSSGARVTITKTTSRPH
jgi:outer membrane biosynthesis protein TonB